MLFIELAFHAAFYISSFTHLAIECFASVSYTINKYNINCTLKPYDMFSCCVLHITSKFSQKCYYCRIFLTFPSIKFF